VRVKATVALALALLASNTGCASRSAESADNTAEICAKVAEVTQPDPEVGRKVTEAFKSSVPAWRDEAAAAQAAMYQEWGKELEPLAEKATNPEVRTAIVNFVGDLKRARRARIMLSP